jgi:hypothetical protein
MHDIDQTLSSVLGAAELVTPAGDRRSSIAARARQLRRRQRAALAIPIGAGVLVVALAIAHPPDGGDSTNVASPRDVSVREVRVPGLHDAIRLSTTAQPVAEVRSFGSITLAGGAVTGATQTMLDDGSVVVLVAVTPGVRTADIEAVPPGGVPVRAVADEGPLLITVPLEDWDPQVVIEVRALDDAGDVLSASRVAPFAQNPLTCETNTKIVGDSAARVGPTRVPHLDAFLAAPLPASCPE